MIRQNLLSTYLLFYCTILTTKMRGTSSSFANSVFSLAPGVTKTFLNTNADSKQNIQASKRFSMMYQSNSKMAAGRQSRFDDARSNRSKYLTKFEKVQQRHLRQITQSEDDLKKIAANQADLMFSQFFKEIQNENPDQVVYFQKGDEWQESFVGDTKSSLSVMRKDNEEQQAEIKKVCESEKYVTSEQLMVQVFRKIEKVKPATERAQPQDDAFLEKMQNDEEESNENVNSFIKILQMKNWEKFRNLSSYIDEVNLIYLVDKFASEDDIAECQKNQKNLENEQEIL